MKKFDDLERVPSNLSEDRYQALEEKEEPNKQNGFYEALTLERNAKPSPGIPEVNQTRGKESFFLSLALHERTRNIPIYTNLAYL